MTRYSVIVNRITTEWTIVAVEAASEEAAEVAAVEKVKSNVSACDWDWTCSEFEVDEIEDLDEAEDASDADDANALSRMYGDGANEAKQTQKESD